MKILIRVVAFVVVVAASGVALGQAFPNVRLDVGSPPGAARSSWSRLAAAGSSVYAVWLDDRDAAFSEMDVYFNRSLDGGATWMASDVVLDASSRGIPSSAASVACDGASVYVVWIEGPTNPTQTGEYEVSMNRSLDHGETWMATEQSLSQQLGQRVTTLAFGVSGDSIYVVWEDDRNGWPEIFFDCSHDAGTTWLGADRRIAASSAYVPPLTDFGSSIDLSVAGTSLYLVWEDDRNSSAGGPRDIYFQRSLDGGLTWLAEDVRLDTAGGARIGDSRNPRVVAQGQAVFVVWDDDVSGLRDVAFNRSLDGGTTWLPRHVRLDRGTAPGASASTLPQVAVGGSSVYVSWRDTRDGLGEIYFNRSSDMGATWQIPDVRLDTGDEPDSIISHDVRMDAEGDAVYVVWADWEKSTAVHDVGLNRSLDGGRTWLPAHVHANSGHTASIPSVAAGPSSTYVAWTDDRNGSPDIYFAMPLGHRPYGTGTAGSEGQVPGLSAVGAPGIGTTFSLGLSNGLGGALVVILYGYQGRASIPMVGGLLLVQPPALHRTLVLGGAYGVPGAGSLKLPIDIPDDVSLIGRQVNTQAGVFDPAATGGVALTAGLESWIL